jgi:hypothetical protein
MPNRAIQAGLQPCCRISMLLGDFAVWITRRKQISREPFTSFEVIFPLIAGVVQAEYPNSLRNGPIFWPELRTVSFLLPLTAHFSKFTFATFIQVGRTQALP